MRVFAGTVNAGGEIVVSGRRYWAAELIAKRGWEVEVHHDQEDAVFASVWTRGRLHRLCTVGLIAIPPSTEAEGIERALVIRRKTEALAQLIDQRLEYQRVNRVGIGRRLFRKAFDLLLNQLPRTGMVSIQDSHDRDLEEAERLDIEMRLAEAIFGDPQAVLGAELHDTIPILDADEAKRIARAVAAHRLSETSK
jgi:hypothetical protein